MTAGLAVWLRDPATWRDLGWQIVHGTLGCLAAVFVGAIAVLGVIGVLSPLLLTLSFAHFVVGDEVVTNPLGTWPIVLAGAVLILLAFAAYWVHIVLSNAISRALLGPSRSVRLVARVAQLAETRAAAVDAQSAELRRIERDLHDGPQAHLVALVLNLGLAEQLIARDPHGACQLVTEARGAAGTALGELRDVVRGIHPPLLADRGLPAAVEALALAAALPVALAIDLPDRLDPALESALYFTAAELLTNATRHSGANVMELRLHRAGALIRLEARDDGRGGASFRRDGGLAGLRRRLSVFDGRIAIDSPLGGPTTISVELPCVS